MRILFIFPRPSHYDSEIVRKNPSGGTEKAVIFLGEAFQKLGHKVIWATTPGQDMPTDVDVVITQHAEFFEHYPHARKVWWTHHFSDQPIIKEQAVWARCWADVNVTLSQCHSQDFHSNLRLDSVTIGHGVWLDEVVQGEKDPFRLIYASTPFRGLERIPELFAEIKSREPRATIGIASSMATYGDTEGDEQYRGLFDTLRSLEGVELLGSLNQEQLYAEYARASIFFYPCIWRETYCLAMDEAIAHGCFPVISDIGALGERAAITESESLIDDILSAFEFGNWSPGNQPSDWLTIAQRWEREVLA